MASPLVALVMRAVRNRTDLFALDISEIMSQAKPKLFDTPLRPIPDKFAQDNRSTFRQTHCICL